MDQPTSRNEFGGGFNEAELVARWADVDAEVFISYNWDEQHAILHRVIAVFTATRQHTLKLHRFHLLWTASCIQLIPNESNQWSLSYAVSQKITDLILLLQLLPTYIDVYGVTLYASAEYAVVVCLSVCLSVCHKSVLYQNG